MSGSDHTTENWLGLVAFPGYDVSDRGRVRSYWKLLGYRYGYGLGDTPQALKLRSTIRGYLAVNLRHRSGKIMTRGVHLVVLEAFRGLKQPGQVCRHLNDVKTENNVENLEWGTSQENSLDRFRNGYVQPSGADYTGPKWSEAAVNAVHFLRNQGMRPKSIAKRLRMSPSAVNRICPTGKPPGYSMAKLAEDQVREIRRLRSAGMKQQDIAERFGVARSLISMICSGKVWAHLT